jgi:hypothetical protein
LEATVNVIVTCTNRKTQAVVPDLLLRAVNGTSIQERARLWLNRLCTCSGPQITAERLYSGDHWTVVRSLAAVANSSGLVAKIWISSAGYGLIAPSAPLKSYSATFSVGHPDSVSRRVGGINKTGADRLWWSAISKWKGPSRTGPRTIAGIAETWPRSPLLVIASPPYLNAMIDDLETALLTLKERDSLIIISAGAKSLEGLTDNLVPCDARLQARVGGARHSLNVRIAKMVLRQARRWPLRLSILSDRLEKLVAEQSIYTRLDRRPMTDEQVRQYIAKSLAQNSRLKHTPLLRQLRDGGWACEQSRFNVLFNEVKVRLS